MVDKHTDIIRVGIVSSINFENCTAKVTFEDRENIVTEEFPLIVPKTLKDKYYYMPDVGERVVVVFNPITSSKGFILGSYYCDTRKIPENLNENKAHVTFDDKTIVEYDREKHELYIEIKEKGETSINIKTASDIKINCEGNIKIDCLQKIEVNSVDRIDINSDADIKIHSMQNIKMIAEGKIDIESGDEMTLNGSTILLN